jgi:hypothetical protein
MATVSLTTAPTAAAHQNCYPSFSTSCMYWGATVNVKTCANSPQVPQQPIPIFFFRCCCCFAQLALQASGPLLMATVSLTAAQTAAAATLISPIPQAQAVGSATAQATATTHSASAVQHACQGIMRIPVSRLLRVRVMAAGRKSGVVVCLTRSPQSVSCCCCYNMMVFHGAC